MNKTQAVNYLLASGFSTGQARCIEKAFSEPKKGCWVPYLEEGLLVKCSECESRFTVGYNFCPNCGADMRGEEV